MPKKTTLAIIASENDYIIQVKENQPNLYHQLEINTSNDTDAISVSEDVTRKRGRIENRKVLLFDNLTDISKEWIGFKRLIRVERVVTRKSQTSHETSFYISSLDKDDATIFAEHIRNHWGIENKLHWVKDVTMKEDKSKTAKGNAAENISILRNIAINLFRTNGFTSIKYATQFYANNIKELQRIISSKIKYKQKT